MLVTSAIALLPAASPVPPAPSTGTATSTLPENHHDGALKPRQTDYLPAEYWPEAFPPVGWQGVEPGWGAVSRPCHASQFYSCAGPYLHGDDTCQNANPYNGGEFTRGWGCFCDHATKFFKCMSRAQDDDANCWQDGYTGGNWQMNWYHNWCGDTPPPSVMAQMSQPRTIDVSYTTLDSEKVIIGGGYPHVTRVSDPIYKGSGSLLSGECTSTDFTPVRTSTDGGDTIIYVGFQGCNGDRPQCCPWPVATNSTHHKSPATVNLEIEPEIEIEHKSGDDYPQPAHGHTAKLKHCPDDYYSVSGGCCPVGYYFFTAALGGQTPCWSSLSSTASILILTTKIAAAQDPITTGTSGNGSDGDDDNDEPADGDDTKPASTSAINNIVFSRHYPINRPRALSLGGYIGIALGISVPVSAAASALIWFWRHRRKQRRERLRRATEQADNNRYTRVWDGPHGSDEYLLRGPGQELQTFNTTTSDHMTADRNGVYTTPKTHQFHQYQQYSGLHAVGKSTSGMNTDYTPGFPPPVHIPPRVSSAAAANNAKYSYGQPISSTASGIPPVKHNGNPWGAHTVANNVDFDAKGGGQARPVDSKVEKLRVGKEEENPFEEMGGASLSSTAGSSSHHNGNQQQRQSNQHFAGLPRHPVARAVSDRRENGYGLEEEEGHGYHEPPPEYRE